MLYPVTMFDICQFYYLSDPKQTVSVKILGGGFISTNEFEAFILGFFAILLTHFLSVYFPIISVHR